MSSLVNIDLLVLKSRMNRSVFLMANQIQSPLRHAKMYTPFVILEISTRQYVDGFEEFEQNQ